MGKFFLKRLGAAIGIVAVLALVMVVLSQLSPVNPGRVALGPQASAEAVAAYNSEVGFSDPVPVRYVRYVRDLANGDLGVSFRTQRPVATDIRALMPATLELACFALLLSLGFGLVFGSLGSVSWKGANSQRVLLTVIGSAPSFMLAFALLIVFGQRLGWLPLSGRTSYADAPEGPTGFLLIDTLLAGQPDMWLDALAHLILPALSIAAVAAVAIGRVLRSSLRETLGADFIQAARAKGLTQFALMRRHALRNSAGPALAVTGLQFGYMLAGVVIVEQIFGWPGVGNYLAEAIPSNDFPVVAAVTLLLAVAYVLINMIVDLLQAWADPRIKSTT